MNRIGRLWWKVRRGLARWRGELLPVCKVGDLLPDALPRGKMVRMVDKGRDWSVGFTCPCGCAEPIELLLQASFDPHWLLREDAIGRPTLTPSVWRNEGCRSHFFVRRGRIIWV